jgi:hypothetical protein
LRIADCGLRIVPSEVEGRIVPSEVEGLIVWANIFRERNPQSANRKPQSFGGFVARLPLR